MHFENKFYQFVKCNDQYGEMDYIYKNNCSILTLKIIVKVLLRISYSQEERKYKFEQAEMQRSRGLPAASESFSYQIVLYRHLDHQVLRALEHPLLLCINDIYNIISYKNECQKSPFTKGENDKIIQVHLETLSKCTSFSLPSSNT